MQELHPPSRASLLTAVANVCLLALSCVALPAEAAAAVCGIPEDGVGFSSGEHALSSLPQIRMGVTHNATCPLRCCSAADRNSADSCTASCYPAHVC